ncbi:hypothetical protein [Nocardiopsis sp. CC223A]|uniref:hypothetical protein n=1 Tax=Nocardiopsis sp. CC223A TaxID=3044051 RepID=UPI00278BB5F6|nr:hypothetical protein [Nocardiopsis sp. CC223A]
MNDMTPQEERFYATASITVLYDIFVDTATRLSGKYVALSRKASTEDERRRWWAEVMELRDLERSVDPDDREALIAHIEEWRAEVARLQGR